MLILDEEGEEGPNTFELVERDFVLLPETLKHEDDGLVIQGVEEGDLLRYAVGLRGTGVISKTTYPHRERK